jgi:hypothetical protein
MVGNGRRIASAVTAATALFAATTIDVVADPKSSEFDIERAFLHDGSRFEPFLVEETHSLAEALEQGRIDDDTSLLVMEHPDAGRLALVTVQMAYHHVAQGEIAGEPWMVDF